MVADPQDIDDTRGLKKRPFYFRKCHFSSLTYCFLIVITLWGLYTICAIADRQYNDRLQDKYFKKWHPRNPNGKQPKGLIKLMKRNAKPLPWATTSNAFAMMLDLRNAQPAGGAGSVGDTFSQWQSYFWVTQQKWLEHEAKENFNICEVITHFVVGSYVIIQNISYW